MKKFKITVIVYGKTITAVSDGTEEGTVITAYEADLNVIKSAIRRGRSVDIKQGRQRDSIVAGYNSPLALTAALCSLDEMRSIVWSAPKEVTDFLRNGGDCGNFIIEDDTEGN